MFQLISNLLVLAASCSALVTLDPSPRQTFTSFGASGAWWPIDISSFSEAAQQKLGELLFSDDGIYLSSYRYNVGAQSGNDSVYVNGWDRQVECFLLKNGSYDFSRDQAGINLLKMAVSHNVEEITFFINSAPSAIAGNNAACGWGFSQDKVQPYAQFVKTVLEYWVQQGINITYISPMNEPDYNHLDCGQEGMYVPPTFRTFIFKAIREALNGGPAESVGIIGDETSQIGGQALLEYPFWLPDSAPSLSHIAIHNYDYPYDDQVTFYYEQVQFLTQFQNRTPSIKFTETCCSTGPGHGPFLFGAQYDPTMVNALIDARYVWQYITLAQAVSFDWWSAVSGLPCSPSIDGAQCYTAFNASNGFNSALLYYDPNFNQTHDYNFYTTKRTYMMKHLAYFHRPGSVRYDVPQTQLPTTVNAIASKLDNTWSIFFMNSANSSANLYFSPPDAKSTLSRVVQTTPYTDWNDTTSDQKFLSNGTLSLVLPAQSFTTLQFSN